MRFLLPYIFVILFCFGNGMCWGQDKKESLNSAAESLENSLSINDNLKIAKSYETLADEYIAQENYAKAEEVLKKAVTNYKKLKLKEDEARVTRKLAKVQEALKDYKSATLNYSKASKVSKQAEVVELNENDEKRLKAGGNDKMSQKYIQSNIQLLKNSSAETPASNEDQMINSVSDMSLKSEAADAYVQDAKLNLKQAKKKDAINSYNQALDMVKGKPSESLKIQKEITKIYRSDNNYDQAIKSNEKLLADAVTQKDLPMQRAQWETLASIYMDNKDPVKAEQAWKEAYSLSLRTGNVDGVKRNMDHLNQYYSQKRDSKEQILLYKDYISNMEPLFKNDSSSINKIALQATEDKINQLEKERDLKDQLITKKNALNYILIGSLILLLLFFILIAKALYAIKTKNKKIALQSLRREMNPHFIFNSLNSVNQFISQNNELKANKFLTSYSKLMRKNMENSNKDFVTLSNEIEQLQEYLELEHLRFQDKFDFQIVVDEALDLESILIPNMIIQPHLENAIWHGLRYLGHKGWLHLRFSHKDKSMTVTIEDNGIGISKSQELKTQNQKIHKSRGVSNTKERIHLLNELYKKQITLHISEKQAPEEGTVVVISFLGTKN